MRLLLTQVAQRLVGNGGEPVIQLQTAFGGGKTHTMLAVYHLATRKCALSDLAGIPSLVEQAGMMDVPQARVAVLDGTAHAPGQAWKHGRQTIKTLWGELAWQLGGSEGYALVKEADTTGTSPGKDLLRDLLAQYAPCIVLIDELVAYVRQFSEGQPPTRPAAEAVGCGQLVQCGAPAKPSGALWHCCQCPMHEPELGATTVEESSGH